MGMLKLNMLDTISQRKGFGMAAVHPTEPCQPLDRQHIDGQSAVHCNLGEYSGQRKPMLDLLGRQDIADSASFMEAWKCLT